MGEYKKILAAVDVSDSSKNALYQAVSLAKEAQGEVAVLTVMPYFEVEVELAGGGDILDVMKDSADSIRQEAVDAVKAEGVPASGKLGHGRAYECIVREAEAFGCDLSPWGGGA